MATITGTALDDVLHTTDGVDAVSALGGNDIILIGNLAHDAGETVNGGTGYDRIWFTGSADGQSLNLLAGVAAVEAVILADAAGRLGSFDLNLNASAVLAGLELIGNDGDNIITGTARNDVLIGNLGADILNGGAGNDRIVISLNEATLDTANAGLATEGNTLVLTGTAAGTLVIDLGAAGDQLLSINAVAEAQVQQGFSHVDASHVRGAGGLQVTGTAAVNSIIGSAQADTIVGGAASDLLSGGAGNDLFLVSSGLHQPLTEVLGGGKGTDTLRFTSTDPVTGTTLTLGSLVTGLERVEIADAGGLTTGTTNLHVNAAAVRKTPLTLVGNDGNNRITGTLEADTITGNAGNDTLVGGGGDDRYVVEAGADSTALDVISDSAGTEDFLVFTSITAGQTLTIGAGVVGVEAVYLSADATTETLDLSGATALHVDATAAVRGLLFKGNNGANLLAGGRANDTFEGGGGIDTLNGGLGADVAVMDAAALDWADGGAANDLGGNTLRFSGTAGGLLDVNLLLEGDGNDQMSGDAPVQADFTHVDATEMAGDGVRVTASGRINKLIGSAQNDVFVYSSSAHTTNDTIDGGGHEVDGDGDLLDGGDIIRFTSVVANQTLILTAGMTGIETVQVSDFSGNLDAHTARVHVNASAVANALSIEGGAGQNTLIGTAGEDTLNGNGGIDTLDGGLASDTYRIDSLADYVLTVGNTVGDRIADSGSGGDDRVLFASTTDGDVLTLNAATSGIEKVQVDEDAGNVGLSGALLGAGATFLGNDGDNTLTGSNFADTIEGGLGIDDIVGGGGADRIVVNLDDGGDGTINAGALAEQNVLALTVKDDLPIFSFVIDLSAADQVLSIAGNQSGFLHVDGSGLTYDDPEFFETQLVIIGTSGANNLVGSNGEDSFRPGLGNDTIEGGGGADSFIISSQAEYDGDVYLDSGPSADDYIRFDSAINNQTLIIRNNVFGVDVGAAGLSAATTTDLHLDARLVDQPFGLAGNAGNNMLQSTRHGESLFDWGGADTMRGGGGFDDYTLMVDTGWILESDPNPRFDSIVDTGVEIDDFYFADSNSSMTLVIGNRVSGVERFIISSGELSQGGPFRRDNTTTNDAGIDASAITHAIVLAGNDGANVLIATNANDTIEGFLGADTIVARGGTDQITMDVSSEGLPADNIDSIDAGLVTENNSLILKGEALARLNIDLASATDQITSLTEVVADVPITTAEGRIQIGLRHVDAASLVGDYGVAVFGSSAVNRITGSAQDDILEGNAGLDVVIGGGGNDAFVLRNTTHHATGEVANAGAGDADAVWFAWNGGLITFRPSATGFVGFEVLAAADDTGSTAGVQSLHLNANLLTTSMKLVGNDGANALTGTARADTLIGNGGADTLAGGLGNDVYLYEAPDEAAPGERINDSGGVDVLRFVSEISGDLLVLGANTTGLDVAETSDEDGDLTGIFALGIDASAVATRLTMRGNDGDNTLIGGAGNDTIIGNLGIDSIVGGLGVDHIETGIEADTLDDINAGALGDGLGGGNSLVVKGEAAGEMVWDLTAVDQLVTVNGVDEGRAISGITHLDLSQVTEAEATITGTSGVNRLIGTALDDTFIVLAQSHFGANEVITGGAGSDRIVLTSMGAGLLTLTARVTGVEEVLVGSLLGDTSGLATIDVNAAAVRNGLKIETNDGNNVITGTAFADVILANAGADTVTGGLGTDKITTDVALEDRVIAGALAENNEWVLEGAAAGMLVFNLAAADQLLTGTLLQSGFNHLDASEVTGFGIQVTGSAAANRIAGTELQDTINGGLGADVISMDVTSSYDAIDAGALTEGNELRLTGAAPGVQTVNLAAAGDQVAGALVQSGFSHLDASDMTGFAVDVTGSSGANRITGTTLQDTIVAGAGADLITMDVTDSFDFIDAGAGSEGDTLRLIGNPGGALTIDLGAAAGTDQLTGAGDTQVQADLQHVDASELDGGFQLIVRGSGAHNLIKGTAGQDRITGRAGADTIDLGTDPETGEDDGEEDHVIYEALSDGVANNVAATSRDRILHFDAGQDRFVFRADFNGGSADLDDIENNNGFLFAAGPANFSVDHEALFLDAAASKLGDAGLFNESLANVARSVNRIGVKAELGDDGLIVVQGKTSTGVYYYQEKGTAGVQTTELTLLGIADALVQQGDFLIV